MRHLDPDKGSFLRLDETNGPNAVRRNLQVWDLAELILNLQHVEGFRPLMLKMYSAKARDIEAIMGELRVARLLYINGHQFRFVEATGGRRTHDLEITLPDGAVVCGETKCKITTTTLQVGTIENALRKASKQLRADVPGVIFLHFPQEWYTSLGTDETHAHLKAVADAFFDQGRSITRPQNTRVVAVVFYCEPINARFPSRDAGLETQPDFLMPLTISRTTAFRRLQSRIGSSTYLLNTLLVGLKLIADGGGDGGAIAVTWTKPATAERAEQTANQARALACKGTLVLAADTIDSFFRHLVVEDWLRFNLETKEIATKARARPKAEGGDYSVAERAQVICRELAIDASAKIAALDLLTKWRNNLVHFTHSSLIQYFTTAAHSANRIACRPPLSSGSSPIAKYAAKRCSGLMNDFARISEPSSILRACASELRPVQRE